MEHQHRIVEKSLRSAYKEFTEANGASVKHKARRYELEAAWNRIVERPTVCVLGGGKKLRSDLETVVGNDIKITWETAGGRSDVLLATDNLMTAYSAVGSTNTIPGVGLVTTNVVEVGGAASSNRFYKIRYAP